MNGRIITIENIKDFRRFLIEEEKSSATIEKYMRDVRAFTSFISDEEITKDRVIAYKNTLINDNYAPRSINSMLASLNSLFSFLGWLDLKVKAIKLQRQIYCSEDKELTKAEYTRLVKTANQKGNKRLCLLLQTICGTGMRVSELQFITVEAVKNGEATVSLKGKTRTVFIVKELKKKLLRYAAEQGIKSSCIFIKRTGKPMSRTNIWREMKALCIRMLNQCDVAFDNRLGHIVCDGIVFHGVVLCLCADVVCGFVE